MTGDEHLMQAIVTRSCLRQSVETHGQITRRETAELCRISPPQAVRLLDHLVRQGTLQRIGQRGSGVAYGRRPA